MIRRLVTAALASLVVAFSWAARADGDAPPPARAFAGAGLIVSADRMMPLLTYESVTVTDPSNSSASATVNAFSVALVTNGPQNTFLTIPRMGVDIVVTPNLTLGLSAWVATTLSESLQIKGQSSSQDLPKSTFWGFAPRVGYVIPLGDSIAFWPRAGIEYFKQNTNTVNTQSGTFTQTQGGAQEYQFSVDVEGALVILPVHHFGITLTAYGAIPIVGGVSGASSLGASPISAGGQSLDASQLGIGLTLGLLGYL